MMIYGAGMAGLLAGHMLRRHEPVICEAQKSLPNNHSAVLRFRTRAVSEATHIPFQEVLVHKAIFYQGELRNIPTLAIQNLYSQKVAGIIRNRSIISTEPSTRYIAPPDFIAQLARGLDIEYDQPLLASQLRNSEEPAISTIPMKMLARMAKFELHSKEFFRHSPIWTLTLELAADIDVYQTIYYPEAEHPFYRATVTGNRLTVEFIEQPIENMALQYAHMVMEHFGIYNGRLVESDSMWSKQVYGKLIPMEDNLRQQFITYMTDKFNIYSLGRFGTWRQILLDDVVNDVRVIDKLIGLRSRYAHALARVNKETNNAE